MPYSKIDWFYRIIVINTVLFPGIREKRWLTPNFGPQRTSSIVGCAILKLHLIRHMQITFHMIVVNMSTRLNLLHHKYNCLLSDE